MLTKSYDTLTDEKSNDTKESELPATTSKKRKSEAEDTTTDAKRQAVSDEYVVLDDSENPKVYVRGLPWKATHDEIKEFFGGCGKIKSVDLPLLADGRSSGTAVIEFESPAGSAAAMEQNGADFGGRWLNSTSFIVHYLFFYLYVLIVHLHNPYLNPLF